MAAAGGDLGAEGGALPADAAMPAVGQDVVEARRAWRLGYGTHASTGVMVSRAAGVGGRWPGCGPRPVRRAGSMAMTRSVAGHLQGGGVTTQNVDVAEVVDRSDRRRRRRGSATWRMVGRGCRPGSARWRLDDRQTGALPRSRRPVGRSTGPGCRCRSPRVAPQPRSSLSPPPHGP